ncbi:MAG: CHAT domain-containing protein [Proteobacteria bacterium]|nr:CHAT domain-containing protein [Pseudomonadota bacterium]MBU4294333.1 CHAT domain-containing protein [Pseudomonadota bacterium]MCG2749120.1 CHAT domain-containing protein [Desulfobulbaceae bacterium]
MIKLIVEGKPHDTTTTIPDDLRDLLVGERCELVDFDLDTRSRGVEEAPPPIEIKANEDDLLELELEGGARIWMSVAEYRDHIAARSMRGPQEKGTVRINASLPQMTEERGILQWVVKRLRFLGFDVAEGAAEKLAERIDTRKGLEGLYSCSIDKEKLELYEHPDFPSGADPFLVFIHGTMSSTEGSFGGLWSEQPQVRRRLAEHYDGRTYAFEHKTFSESPIVNALALAKALPDGARLHLVSHSRGGMIGELLCRGGRLLTDGATALFDDTDFKLFKAADQAVPRSALRELEAVLRQKRFTVERFVRVACPARGTTLASKRLDRYLSLLNLGLSSLDKSGWAGDILWLVGAIIKERTDPRVMPGLEAMMPESTTVKLLNRSDVTVTGALRVIAGDYDGGSILGWVANWATEGFFGSENDTVINTPSMYGGALRQENLGWYYFAQGSNVWHFSYFREQITAGLLADGLLQDGTERAGFLPISQAPHRHDPIGRGVALDFAVEGWGAPLGCKAPSANGRKPLVLLVPGIMGSHLQVADRRVWLDFLAIARGKLKELDIDASGVTTDGAMKLSYGDFGSFLSAKNEVIYFPYDWRRPLREQGTEFARFMGQVLDAAAANGRPVRIVAHSMGGLLVRMAAVLSNPERNGNRWWERFSAAGTTNRLVMAGTPNKGSWTVPYALTGRDSIVKVLAAVDLSHDREEILRCISGFTGFLEMLPDDGDGHCFDIDSWEKWQKADGEEWPLPDAALLAACRENRRLLDRFDFTGDAGIIRYVAGCEDETPSGVRIVNAKGRNELIFDRSTKGDGRVLWATGIPKGIKTWYVNAAHGDILNQEDAFNGLSEIIEYGETSLLPTEPPARRALAAGEEIMVDRGLPMYPDQNMLIRAALGGRILPPRDRRTEKFPAFKVVVCHGDLLAARNPVAVGHYFGDTINGSEAVLDRRLDGLLTRRYQLGIYTGAEGSVNVFVHTENKKKYTAIIIGLGQVGELTQARLANCFARAILEFATSPAVDAIGPQGVELSISTLLIGSGSGWGLGVQESVRGLVDGARRANMKLAELDGAPIRLRELELLEIFEDRALIALRAVRSLATLGGLAGVEYEASLRCGTGGLQRAVCEDGGDWWQRLKVEMNDKDELKFTSLTGLARIEERGQPTQLALVDRLVKNAVTNSSISTREMNAIYNLLFPNSLKMSAPDQGDLLLMLDPKTAGYPWEMMYVGEGTQKEPLALRAGLIRQLSLPEFRERPVYSSRQHALVIADPDLKSSKFPELSGALQEGKAVVRILEQKGFQVERQLQSDPLSIAGALFAGDYRILHLAGHGVFEYPITSKGRDGTSRTSLVTGMVLEWPTNAETEKDDARQDPVLLTAVEVRQMIAVPELVFINCCFLGQMEGLDKWFAKRHLFAASLAAKFISMGVRAVVAAGWAVNDSAAEIFATSFYNAMFDGHTFGDAVRAARCKAHEQVGSCNTWAAYQCYGDPGFRFRENHAARPRKFFLAPREVVCELRALGEKKRDARGNRLSSADLTRDLEQLERLIPHEWMIQNGEIRAALAAVYAELGDNDRAIEHYEAAEICRDGGCTVRDLNQLSNLRVRRAQDYPPEQADKEILREIEILTRRAGELGETPDICTITGSAVKRLLLKVADKKPTKKKELADLIRLMEEWYEKAVKSDGELDPYAAMNSICAAIIEECWAVSPSPNQEKLAKIRNLLDQATMAGQRLEEKDPRFWNGVHAIDADLYRFILTRMKGGLEIDGVPDTKELNERYNNLADKYGTPRKMGSVADQIKFVARFLPEKEMKEVKHDLEKLAENLRKG